VSKKGIGSNLLFPIPKDQYTKDLTLVLENIFKAIDSNLQFVTRPNTTSVTSTYTVIDSDSVILANGTFAVTIPFAKPSLNRSLVIKNIGSGTVTVTAQSGEYIDGDATYAMAAQYDTVQIVSDGTDWHIISTK
jgi:hypothetical protein